MPVDNLEAGLQIGSGPKFAADVDGASLGWPLSKLAFGAVNVTYTIVDDSFGNRFPVKSTPAGATATDASNAIGTGGLSQIVFAQNLARTGGFIINPPTAVEPLYVNFPTAATEDNHSVMLLPGERFDFFSGGVVITDQISVVATSAGHLFTAKSLQ